MRPQPPTRHRPALRKLTDRAENRMRTRTAKEQLADFLASQQRGQDHTVPDADDAAAHHAYRPSHERPPC
jgi:hypothetical protein